MGKPKEIKVNTMEEFRNLVDKKHFSISQAIVSSILSNLKTRKKNVHVLSIKCLEENTIFDITLERTNFSETLKENLKYFEQHEMYEECIEIDKAIKALTNSKSVK
jgi:hypothetical protein